MDRKIFPENQTFVCGWAGRALSSEARWVGASINGAAGIRCCDLRCPESAGNLRHQRTRRDRAVFLISPTDSGHRRLEKELCADIIMSEQLPGVAPNQNTRSRQCGGVP